jgi:hypothetical protein
MERRSCNDRLKPPPHRGQYSVAVDTGLLNAGSSTQWRIVEVLEIGWGRRRG